MRANDFGFRGLLNQNYFIILSAYRSRTGVFLVLVFLFCFYMQAPLTLHSAATQFKFVLQFPTSPLLATDILCTCVYKNRANTFSPSIESFFLQANYSCISDESVGCVWF